MATSPVHCPFTLDDLILNPTTIVYASVRFKTEDKDFAKKINTGGLVVPEKLLKTFGIIVKVGDEIAKIRPDLKVGTIFIFEGQAFAVRLFDEKLDKQHDYGIIDTFAVAYAFNNTLELGTHYTIEDRIK